MTRFKSKAEVTNALRLKFISQDWNALSMNDGNFLLKYKGIDDSLFYIFININFKNDFICLKAQFPHSFLRESINNLLVLCNLVNKSYLEGNLFVDIEKKQIYVKAGIQSFQYGSIEKLIVSYLYTLLDQIEVLNKVLLNFFKSDKSNSNYDISFIKQKNLEWEKERQIENWSFKL